MLHLISLSLSLSLSLSALWIVYSPLQVLYFLKNFSFHSPLYIIHWNSLDMLFINCKGLVELSNQVLDLSIDGDEICLSLYLLYVKFQTPTQF
jgi:hypothetical protein